MIDGTGTMKTTSGKRLMLDFLIEEERRNRIRLSVFAYAYEFQNESFVSDHEFDELAKKIDPSLETGNKPLDEFFKTQYNAFTGQWIHKHPDLDGIKKLYKKYKEYYK